jgi:Ca2+-binding EF-hand superfamily protein
MYFLNKDLSNEDIRFFFDRIDEDCSGTISVYEIEKMMNFHKIRTSILKKAVTSYYEGR